MTTPIAITPGSRRVQITLTRDEEATDEVVLEPRTATRIFSIGQHGDIMVSEVPEDDDDEEDAEPEALEDDDEPEPVA